MHNLHCSVHLQLALYVGEKGHSAWLDTVTGLQSLEQPPNPRPAVWCLGHVLEAEVLTGQIVLEHTNTKVVQSELHKHTHEMAGAHLGRAAEKEGEGGSPPGGGGGGGARRGSRHRTKEVCSSPWETAVQGHGTSSTSVTSRKRSSS